MLSNLSEDDEITDCAKIIISRYSMKILAITDGPSGAYLFEKVAANIVICTRFKLPKLTKDLLDMEPVSPNEKISNSLPEATGETFQPRMQSSTNLKSLLNLHLEEDLILNPLGAGDTCSAIFLLEYLDTRVFITN